MEEQKNKVIAVDWSIILHRSAYAMVNNPTIPCTYTAMIMLISCLKLIGVDKNDLVLLCLDARNSWRKDYEKSYKGNRPQQKQESGLDWNKIYQDMDWLINKIDRATNFHLVKAERCEADDCLAVVSRYYKDKEVILVSYDSDLIPLMSYPNVKIFSPHPKVKSYKIKPPNFDPYKLIMDKVNKEKTDNMTDEINSEISFENRLKCVNLLELPDWVEDSIIEILSNLPKKENIYLEELPFKKVRETFMDIYKKDKVIDYNSIKPKKKRRKKKKDNKVAVDMPNVV